MAGSYAPQTNPGSFVTTTRTLNVSEVYDLTQENEALKQVLVRLYEAFNDVSISMNTRDAGYYFQPEFVCGQIYYPNPVNTSTTGNTPLSSENRQVFRTVVPFGALPNTGTKTVPHGINILPSSAGYLGFTFTRIYGAASDTVGQTYIPIPYVSSTSPVSLTVTATDVSITTTANLSNYTVTYVILEYIKS